MTSNWDCPCIGNEKYCDLDLTLSSAAPYVYIKILLYVSSHSLVCHFVIRICHVIIFSSCYEYDTKNVTIQWHVIGYRLCFAIRRWIPVSISTLSRGLSSSPSYWISRISIVLSSDISNLCKRSNLITIFLIRRSICTTVKNCNTLLLSSIRSQYLFISSIF